MPSRDGILVGPADYLTVATRDDDDNAVDTPFAKQISDTAAYGDATSQARFSIWPFADRQPRKSGFLLYPSTLGDPYGNSNWQGITQRNHLRAKWNNVRKWIASETPAVDIANPTFDEIDQSAGDCWWLNLWTIVTRNQYESDMSDWFPESTIQDTDDDGNPIGDPRLKKWYEWRVPNVGHGHWFVRTNEAPTTDLFIWANDSWQAPGGFAMCRDILKYDVSVGSQAVTPMTEREYNDAILGVGNITFQFDPIPLPYPYTPGWSPEAAEVTAATERLPERRAGIPPTPKIKIRKARRR